MLATIPNRFQLIMVLPYSVTYAHTVEGWHATALLLIVPSCVLQIIFQYQRLANEALVHIIKATTPFV